MTRYNYLHFTDGETSSVMLGNSPEATELVKDWRVVSSGVAESDSAPHLSTPPCGQFEGVSMCYSCTNTSGSAPPGPRDKMGLGDKGGRWRMVRAIRSIELVNLGSLCELIYAYWLLFPCGNNERPTRILYWKTLIPYVCTTLRSCDGFSLKWILIRSQALEPDRDGFTFHSWNLPWSHLEPVA